jgi:hypothetical protein
LFNVAGEDLSRIVPKLNDGSVYHYLINNDDVVRSGGLFYYEIIRSFYC